MGDKVIAKSTQEQATAAWIEYLNNIRFLELVEKLANQDINFELALEELQKLKGFVAHPEHIMGSLISKHGEIAEHVQVNFANAESLVNGESPIYTFEGVGRLAPEDYLKNGQMVQSKFYMGIAGTLRAIADHSDTYPFFLQEDGTYEIPKTQCVELLRIYKSGESDSLLADSDQKLYNAIKEWEAEKNVKFDQVVHPSLVDYNDVQLDTINQTIDNEEKNITEKDQQLREKAQRESLPTFKEGIKVTAVSAAIEGGMTFALGIYKKRKEGKKLPEYTEDDWKELGIDTGKSTIKGAVRGSSIYLLTNFAATPAPIASAMITATFGMTAQAYKLKNGEIDSEEFIDTSEALCLDVATSALSSMLGSIIIPIPVVGAVIGNATGMFMKEIAESYLSSEEEQLIEDYLQDMKDLNNLLNDKEKETLKVLDGEFSLYKSVSEFAFSEDANKRLDTSISVARYFNVPEEKILNEESGDAFFLGK